MMKYLHTPIFLLLVVTYSGCTIAKTVLLNPNQPLDLSSFTAIKKIINDDPITTSFSDIDINDLLPEDFGKDKPYTLLSSMPKNTAGNYLLKSGFYEMTCQSYCIKSGTHGPSQGDGYLYAPLEGKRKELIRAVIKNAEKFPVIQQQQVQQILWAIIARAKFEQLPNNLKLIAFQLLTPTQLVELNGGALGLIPPVLHSQAISHLPVPVRKVLEIENQMRGLFYKADATYDDFERLAVLSGMAVIDRPDIKRGLWTKHSKGYYVRFYPNGYKKTKIQVYVPDNIKLGNTGSKDFADIRTIQQEVEFDATSHVAVPANTGAQRLVISDKEVNKTRCNWTPPANGIPTNVTTRIYQDCGALENSIASGGEFFGLASYRFSSEFTISNVQQVGNSWVASGTVQRHLTQNQIDMAIPYWEGMSQNAADALCTAMDALYQHELGHLTVVQDYIANNSSNDIISAYANTREAAVASFREAVNADDVRYDNNLRQINTDYDAITNQGTHQSRGANNRIPSSPDVRFSCPN